MTSNESLKLSLQFKELVRTDLSHVFQEQMPADLIAEWVSEAMPQRREPLQTLFPQCSYLPLRKIRACRTV